VASWLVIKKPDISMMLNGAIGALVAITAACAFVAPWAAIVIGFVSGVIVVFGVLFVERIGIDDPIGAVAAHGMSGVWGTLALGFLTLPSQARSSRPARPACSTAAASTSSASSPSGSSPSAPSHSACRFLILFALKKTFGIRVEADVETDGLDVHEHGMWGYPEFFIPVPGGYDRWATPAWERPTGAQPVSPAAAARVVPEPS
jgi:Amt family ammonium transporter